MTGCRSTRQAARQNREVQPQVADTAKPQTPSVGGNEEVAPATEKKDWYNMSRSFKCEAEGITVDGLVRMQKDSVIWINLTKMIEVGRIRLTPDSVQAYIKLNNKYVNCTYADLRRWGMDLDYPMVQTLLLGDSLASNTRRQAVVKRGLEEAHRISQITTTTNSPKQMVEVKYHSYETYKVHDLPHKADITINNRMVNTTAKLEFKTTQFDVPLTFPFYIPKSASPYLKSSK